MVNERRHLLAALLMATAAVRACETAHAGDLPKVRAERPRIFFRAKPWDGPSIEKTKQWMDRPEYKAHWEKLLKSELSMNLALRCVLTGDEAAGKQALERYMSQVGGGISPSYWGIKDQRMAALYDWLHDHPAFTAEMRREKLAQLERRCAANMDYLVREKENPFYSRFAGALAALTACALSMHGDNPKADEYLKFAYTCLREKMGTIRQAEDGLGGGACYAYHHEFTDLANLVAAWRSATDWNPAAWIKDAQGDWLRRQMLYQIWMTYPNGQFVKEGDVWGRDTVDDRQYRMSIDAITGMYRHGVGRTWADLIYKRWGVNDYHSEYIWEFFVFNDPEVKPAPLSDLGRAAVFSPQFHTVACWRSGWEGDATMVHFRIGESGDTHATTDQGKFIIYRQRPLAIKNGAYIDFMDPHHRYYRSPWSANCVLFMSRTSKGLAPVLDPYPSFKFSHSNPLWPDGLFSWQEWKQLRERSLKRKVMGVLLESEDNDRFARAAADLSYHVKKGETGYEAVWDWRRELVFLGYKYLIVLDQVRAGKDQAGNEIVHAWTLHTTNEPRVDGSVAVADNGPARLFCKTLLPANARLTTVGGPGHECDHAGANPLPKGWQELNPGKLGPNTQMGAWRLDVAPADPAAECTYLHLLYPTDTKTAAMPDCAVEQRGSEITVRIDTLAYTFRPPSRPR